MVGKKGEHPMKEKNKERRWSARNVHRADPLALVPLGGGGCHFLNTPCLMRGVGNNGRLVINLTGGRRS